MTYAAVTVAAAVELVGRTPGLVAAAIEVIPSSRRRTRPNGTTWSVTEYACHIRDVYATFTLRLHRARTETQPVLEPMLNDVRAKRLRYNLLELDGVLDELTHNAAGLIEETTRYEPTDWHRAASRRPGEARSALWLLRQAAHEGRHHVRDIAVVGHRLDGVVDPPPDSDLDDSR